MKQQKHHVWLARLEAEIQNSYDDLYCTVRQGDPQKAGHMSEEVWLSLLQKWLPEYYPIVTRRYIVSETDEPDSGETDILILNPSYPAPLREKTEILIGGVLAAFSVKSRLNTAGLRSAVSEARAHARRIALPRIYGNPREEMISPSKYGVLAHTHDWGASATETVGKLILELDEATAEHPRECIDYICVANLASWYCARVPFTTNIGAFAERVPPALGYSLTVHGFIDPDSPARPVGSFVACLLFGLARHDPLLAAWAWSLRRTATMGSATGTARVWMLSDVFTPSIIAQYLRRGPAVDESDWGPSFL